jgi:SAM-dependent methyltransferase
MTSSDYDRQYAEQYAEDQFETVLVEIRRRRVLESILPHEPRSVLEVGCGMEPLFSFYESFERHTIVEPSPRFTENARRLADGDGRVEVIEGTLEERSDELAERTFDAVVVSSLLHEVPDARALLRAVHAACDERTVVHVNVPNVRSFHRLLAVEGGLIDDVFEPSEMERRFGRHDRFDAESLRALLESEGFRPFETGTYFVKPFTHAQMDAVLASRAFDRESLLRGLDGMIRHMPDLGCELYANLRIA